MFIFGKASCLYLIGVHPDLIRVAKRALEISRYDFGINKSSVRTKEEQEHLLAMGKSKTLNSRHIAESNQCGLSCAIDINVYVGGKITWDIKYFRKVNQAFVTAAIELGVQIELGCLWESFIDGPHVQLGWKDYL